MTVANCLSISGLVYNSVRLVAAVVLQEYARVRVVVVLREYTGRLESCRALTLRPFLSFFLSIQSERRVSYFLSLAKCFLRNYDFQLGKVRFKFGNFNS